ncbi:MAG: hypothetical protein H7145_21880 [Akkermansiaceae bacterium]|nr:hypothetical protein [Armatimonadota bacterium]
MANIFGAAYDFWKQVKEVSPRGIEDEANSGFKIALVGKPEDRMRIKEAFLTDKATLDERDEAEAHLREFDTVPDPDTAKAFAFTIYTPENEDDAIGARGVGSVPITAPNPAKLAQAMIVQQPHLSVALGRRFPLFRPFACNRIIQDASRTNAQIALISGLPGVFPPAAIILPASSIADVLLLTKNQLMMVMRLAATYGKKPAYTKQIKELMGVIGAALGWRTVARELSGFIPVPGVGLAIKAAIAYSGTLAAGRSALLFYQSGRTPTPKEVQAAYKEAEAEGKAAAAAVVKEVTEKDEVKDKTENEKSED